MGQVNSIKDSEIGSQLSQRDGEQSELEREQQREANSEQVRCVKTRIDMLIEDCLHTKDSPNENENERSGNKEILNINHMICKTGNAKRKENESKNEKGSGKEAAETKADKKDEAHNTLKDDKEKRCDGSVKQDDKHDKTDNKPAAKKEEIKLSDIITDMVNTELTEKQLKHIQQRTITTFNTFIDKVLDNSLKQENVEEKNSKPTNILKLCNESMFPEKGQKSEDSSTNDSDRNEKPECDRDVVKNDTDKKVTLEDHITRFLEMSFRDENEKEEAKSKKNSNLQENFNAQGLVNTMITQGIQINRLLTKEQQNAASQKAQKEIEIQKKQMKYPEQNLRLKSQETYGQKSPNSNNVQTRTELRYNHAVAGQQTADTKFRDVYFSQTKYEPGGRNSQVPQVAYGRRDEILERNREMQAKMNVNASSKHEMSIPSNVRPSDHSSAFHHPHHLQVANNAYYNTPYMPRMQMSPGQLREMKSSLRVENKQTVHVRDCMCAMCIPQQHSRHVKIDPAGIDHHQGKHSPNVPPQFQAGTMAAQTAPGLVREVPAMMRPSHSELPPGMVAYQGMHKLLPHHPPMTSTKVYSGGQLLVPGEMTGQGMVSNRQPSMPENPHYLPHYPQRRVEEYQQNSNNERIGIRSGKQSPYHARPSSLPPHEHNSPVYARPGSGHHVYESDFTRNTDSSSCASDCSNEAPLDLSVKKPKIEAARSRSASNASSVRRITPSNSFIKHLESSVDKYWQELNSPPASPVNTKPPAQMNRPQSILNDGRNVPHGYSRSSNDSSPPNLMTMIQNRPLPSPHYTGGITVGQPLVDMKPPIVQKQTEYTQQTGTQIMNKPAQPQPQFQGNQSNFDINSKRATNNISKHEPIQNIIGNHDPNDILYLICRLCTQTYGSPYGFRKHFRNQHGFEPRAEHTIVQTISGTKSALHLPQQQLVPGMSEVRESPYMRKSISPETEMIGQKNAINTYQGGKRCSESPVDSKSCTGSEEGEKIELENTETKCLECPECGKTFQLNDFGSYKRHCRQHGNIRMNGPFTCTDCHLPFPDQKSLREHYKVHVKDNSTVVVNQEQKVDVTAHKNESHQTFYMCVKCDQQYDNIDTYKKHLTSHDNESKVDTDTESVRNNQTTVSLKSENEAISDIASSKTVVKQAAESNTSLACPDSSWDNVAKVVATSNKLELNPELSESTNSNMSNSSEKPIVEEDKKNLNQILTTQKSNESSSENEKKSEENYENEFIYKHKKFFHHRKRAISSQSLSNDATDAKQAKVSQETPIPVTSAGENVTASSSTSGVANSSCDSTGSSDTKFEENADTNKSVNVSVKTAEKVTEKPTKTEARHSLPFVWDRTTRSQKKL